MKKPKWLDWRATWLVWVFGIGLDFEERTAGLCLGPLALWISW